MRFCVALLLAGATLACASELRAGADNLPAVLRPDRGRAWQDPPGLGAATDQLGCALALRGGESSLTTWFYKTLAKMGIFLKKGRLLVLGLDNAGKSTLLTVLLRNEVVPTAPTHQPVTDVIKVGHMKLRAVDMGGHEIARRMWQQYSHEADGVVYIVDAVDRERFQEAALELHKLLSASTLPPGAPVLILGNKVDLPHAAQQEELYYGLGLDELAQTVRAPAARAHWPANPKAPATHASLERPSRHAHRPPPHRAQGSDRPIGLYMCSVFERRGYAEGFDWLAQYVK